MKSKTGFSSMIIIGVLVVVGAILFQSQRVFAERPSLKTVLGLDDVPSRKNSDDNQSVPINEPFAVEQIDKYTVPEPPAVSANTQAYKQAIDTLERLVGGLDKYYAEGWLHIAMQTESFVTMSDKLPNGDPVPTKWTNDLWILMGDDGYAIKAVDVQDTGDEFTSQTSIFTNGVWTNLTLGLSSQGGEIYRPSLDAGFLDFVNQTDGSLELTMTQENAGGKNVVAFSASTFWDEPIALGKPSNEKLEKINGMVETIYFFTESSLPQKVNVYYVNVDGQQKLVEQIIFDNIEMIDTPPDDILNYFSR